MENIRFGKENATMAEIEEAARQANAHTFIMQLPNVCRWNFNLSIHMHHLIFLFRNMKHL